VGRQEGRLHRQTRGFVDVVGVDPGAKLRLAIATIAASDAPSRRGRPVTIRPGSLLGIHLASSSTDPSVEAVVPGDHLEITVRLRRDRRERLGRNGMPP